MARRLGSIKLSARKAPNVSMALGRAVDESDGGRHGARPVAYRGSAASAVEWLGPAAPRNKST
jgi:hypothetical protein